LLMRAGFGKCGVIWCIGRGLGRVVNVWKFGMGMREGRGREDWVIA